ncbi:MAG: hypothetical protein A3G23_13325 [Bacteroidetes bacterium RIFCSPLOWO2_12_FULL_37_12]|nr:MAG: hypothetical protein A3G23_13325 [Bacteroidetes bacterium RIFCSPLOWO2_12_FULL_37_12]
MTLEGMEFIRRFCMHILPSKFVKIRHYGILSATSKKTTLPQIKSLLPEQSQIKKAPEEPRELNEFKPGICPYCKTETMLTIEIFFKRGPPVSFLKNSA